MIEDMRAHVGDNKILPFNVLWESIIYMDCKAFSSQLRRKGLF